ncbi:MAG TPA: hypothetical protein VEK79_06045 [Thermoanaerobaculia bacterium]|nr:hypothetical protein [Thermoanaerobaculia bacterium]
MRRYAIAVLASLVVTSAAQANWYPQFNSNWVTMQVGETQTLLVTPKWSGITDYGFSPWTFVSDDPSVAVVTGGVGALGATGEVKVIAVAPGNARVRWMTATGLALVEIMVGEHTPPRIAASATRTMIGKAVTLTALYPTTSYAGFTWCEGRIGDTSRRIGDLYATREITYTPTEAGTHYVWVAVSTPYTFGVAEQEIDVLHPRRRAARH